MRRHAAAAGPLAALSLAVPSLPGAPRGAKAGATGGDLRPDGAVAGVSASSGGDAGSGPNLGPLAHGGEATIPILLALLAAVALLVRWELRRR